MAEAIPIIDVVSAIIIIIPSTILLKHYFKTKLGDFRLFAMFFILGGLGLFMVSLSGIYELLILEQLRQWIFSTMIFVLFLHSVKILWEKPPKIIWYTGVIWYTVLMLLGLFFEIFDQPPDKAKVLFLELPHTFSGTHPFGAGVKTEGGTIILSSSYNQLWYLFLIFTLVLLIYSYIKVNPFNPTKRIILAKKLWLAAWISYGLYAVIGIGLNFLFDLGNIFILLAVLIVGYIAFRIPEAMLISEIQILRAFDLYNKVNDLTTEEEKSEFGMSKLVDYLLNLPNELKEQMKK